MGYTTVSPPNAFGTNGYAIPNFNYGTTNGVLNFAPGQTFASGAVAIYQRTTVDPPETFQVALTNASAGTQLSSPSAAVVTIIGDVTGFALDSSNYVTGENGGSVVVTVNRTNVSTGVVSVNFNTLDGTAVAGTDYVTNSGVLTFADGQASANVTVAIINNNILESDKTFSFVLSNPLSTISTNCYLLSPSNAVIKITNTVTAIGFSSPTYSVSEKGLQAQITPARRRDQHECECQLCHGGRGRDAPEPITSPPTGPSPSTPGSLPPILWCKSWTTTRLPPTTRFT